jgi:hypothetical protein
MHFSQQLVTQTPDLKLGSIRFDLTIITHLCDVFVTYLILLIQFDTKKMPKTM